MRDTQTDGRRAILLVILEQHQLRRLAEAGGDDDDDDAHCGAITPPNAHCIGVQLLIGGDRATILQGLVLYVRAPLRTVGMVVRYRVVRNSKSLPVFVS